MIKTLTSFNHFPQHSCTLYRPERYRDLNPNNKKPMIARGLGKSYGDVALNKDGHIVLTERLNRFIEFNFEQGLLTAEVGVTLAEILDLIIPHGWFLPVTPGTAQVTLGGCIASDVHGKNHCTMGSFGNHIQWLELLTANNDSIICSPQQNSDFFWATIGGLGLTGIIGKACIKLRKVTCPHLNVTHKGIKNLDNLLKTFNETLGDNYQVAWLDLINQNKPILLMTGQHLTEKKIIKTTNRIKVNIPFYAPNWLLNKTRLQYFNKLYYTAQNKKNNFVMPYQKYFYPLDQIQNWNRLYGKRGFIQYQCTLPFDNAELGLTNILQVLQKNTIPVYLAVLKKFGNPNNGLLSFPMPGITLAMDIPITNNLFKTLDHLDEIVIKNNGRVYLAKDARLKPEAFRAMYPHYSNWLAIKNKLDPNNMFSSSLSRRLELC